MIKKNMTLRKIGIVTLTLVLMVLVVFLVSRSFAYFNYMKKGDTLNVISIKGIDVEIINDSENNLNINEAYPMYDDEGMNNAPFEFTLTNNSNKALDIVLKIENDIDKQGEYPLLNTNYIRYSYKVGNGEYSEPRNLGANNNIILSDTISKNETKEISIKLWIDKDAPNEVQGHYFFGQLIVEGTKALCTLEPGTVFNFDYTGDVQEFDATCSGYYRIETWGASGGSSVTNHGWATRDVWDTYGYGGYAAGNINLTAGDKLYAYVGAQGATGILGSGNVTSTTFNGGGSGRSSSDNDDGGGAGGGATDIRLTGGNWDNFDSLKSRIMVAGGGSGSAVVDRNFNNRAGASGGGLKGNGSVWKYQNAQVTSHSYNATQTTGYKFGIGENGIAKGNAGGAGAGGGYYGGYASKESIVGGAGGGSGFVSGYEGCDAISENSTSTSITHTGNSLHYSGKVFTNITLKHGNETIIEPNGTESTGHNGNGYARITYLGNNTTTLYSAAVDEVYYYNSDNQKVVIGTTDETGKLENAIVPKNVVLYSSVAKDPNNLSNSYSKEFSNTNANMYLMPGDNNSIIYWYGYTPYEWTTQRGAWSNLSQTSGTITLNRNTNNIYLRTQKTNNEYNGLVGLYKTTTAVDCSNYTKLKTYAEYTNNGSSNYWGSVRLYKLSDNTSPSHIGAITNGTSVATVGEVAIDKTTQTYGYAGIQSDARYYPSAAYATDTSSTIYAIWLE